MTPELCLISVPHNGTLFTIKIFTANGYQEQPLNGRPKREPVLYHGHCEKISQCDQAVALSERMPLVVPVRHPYRVEESWKRRGEDPKRLLQSYSNMLDGIYPRVAVWVPLDADNPVRWDARMNLNRLTGMLLSINWDRPVNVVHHTNASPLSSLDPSSEIMDICKHPLFNELYGEA